MDVNLFTPLIEQTEDAVKISTFTKIRILRLLFPLISLLLIKQIKCKDVGFCEKVLIDIKKNAILVISKSEFLKCMMFF